jgi:phage terminase small subunit
MRPESMRKLTNKQKTFVSEYLVDLNATKAAERAGYSKKTAASIGQENLRKPEIATALAEKQAARFQKADITADRVLSELALLGFANMLDYIQVGSNGEARVDLSKLTREQAAAIGEIAVEEFTERTGEDENGKPTFENVKRTRFKLTDKRAALVDLGKHLKLFTERLEHRVVFSVKDLSDEELEALSRDLDNENTLIGTSTRGTDIK